VTPIRQQNPPGPLKLLGLREKTDKNTDFDFAQITLNILYFSVCIYFLVAPLAGSPHQPWSPWQLRDAAV
jgi:hypothetical protein